MKSDLFYEHQAGMSLPEVMIAVMVFSVSLLGLMRYHQALLFGFQQHWQQSKADKLSYGYLEQYELIAGQNPLPEIILPPGWHAEFQTTYPLSGCYQLTVMVTTSYNQQSKASRWICSNGSSNVQGLSF
ncbi:MULTISPECIES: prepilin-type N-terminal cleavage/methylation domain-containing protein [Photorhabdus]|uniref:Prepilin-type cleavage/methylation domain-containing protein n=1 Tax=Photorhabdus luminescens subsp. mexicana TaxID=2100167 RepID=A0A4R4J5R5_PHOLU|nr:MULTISPECIES: prepilin-type N-terminal cleavage/methylation domain-containing protein [Photorhabdus]MCW7547839.1 prepilin-type N-terminal cleavage/methylation domain-containing protein [Photorhabdus aballayi]MCW7762506.1 prepilin-type N-terminal cleavage/methylation domain-containing protein [Photorhabdus luminescens subsp. venezuelensis]TDB48948.1 prepilin-type cleavage/methylation domain-containing protein [Photorhabdus luminescens subsp. mexicana]